MKIEIIRTENQDVKAGSYGLHRDGSPNKLHTVTHAWVGTGYVGVFPKETEAKRVAQEVAQARARNGAPAKL